MTEEIPVGENLALMVIAFLVVVLICGFGLLYLTASGRVTPTTTTSTTVKPPLRQG